jgi:hypothetical protein
MPGQLAAVLRKWAEAYRIEDLLASLTTFDNAIGR